MTVNNTEAGLPLWEKLCHFLEMKTLLRNGTTPYCTAPAVAQPS